MNIDSILIDLEIIGQVKENDKLAVSNIVGATKLFVNQYSYSNSLYRRYNGFNRSDSINYIDGLISQIESASDKIIEASFIEMGESLKNSISKAITGITNLKETYKLDSEIIAKLTINNNKLNKVLEKLNNFSESIDESVNDIILQESNE